MASINAKFVKCVHSHLTVPTSFPGNVLQPSLDQAREKNPDIYQTHLTIIERKKCFLKAFDKNKNLYSKTKTKPEAIVKTFA